jgi:hypothetical protein
VDVIKKRSHVSVYQTSVENCSEPEFNTGTWSKSQCSILASFKAQVAILSKFNAEFFLVLELNQKIKLSC